MFNPYSYYRELEVHPGQKERRVNQEHKERQVPEALLVQKVLKETLECPDFQEVLENKD